MKIILLRLGIIPRIQKQSKEFLNKTANILDGRKISFKHDRYQIEIGGIWLKRASEVFGVVHPSLAKRKRRNSFGWIKDNFAYLPISKIEEEPYEGKVYNLAVENNNSYTTSGAAVHNCDGYFFTGKEIIVVGGGDSACEEALFLTRFVDKLTIVHRKGVMRASKIMQDRVMKNEKISFLWNHVVEEVEGDEVKVTGVKLKDLTTGELTNKKVDGVFIAIGHDPNTKLFRGKLDLDEKGYLKADKRMHTNIAGVFAAGDVHDTIYRQAITASAMGCMAAIEAEKYLEGLEP